MLKHASICRTKQAQQALRAQLDERLPGNDSDSQLLNSLRLPNPQDDLNNNPIGPSLGDGAWFTKAVVDKISSSCCSSPSPSTPIGKFAPLSSAPPSVFNSPSKSKSQICANIITQQSTGKTGAESTIKIFAQTLSQEVEYVTLHVNAQTKSRHIIRTLLKKFRLKHRDPNLFYLTLERWIRKDGLKFKSVMLLGDDANPLQLQQSCSNPPHNDIKFALQTTVDETIELMLHCLNLTASGDSKHKTDEKFSRTLSSSSSNHMRQASSPSSTGSSSSASSTSSSSGIESDLTNQIASHTSTHCHTNRALDSNSRSSSVTSISSSSNISHTSSNQSASEHFCLVIECENTNYKRVLEPSELLVDVYQGLLEEVKDRTPPHADIEASSNSISASKQQQPDQWFIIKLKRREDLIQPNIKFINPRQNMPLPPIPLSLAQFNNVDDLHHIVSTAQIEVNHQQRRPSSSLAVSALTARVNTPTSGTVEKTSFDTLDGGHFPAHQIATASSRPINHHQKQISAVVGSKCDKMPSPPATLIWLPPIKPRRRNLSNASSTFGRPLAGSLTGVAANRRRYDPAQLAEDLDKLDLTTCKSVDMAGQKSSEDKLNDAPTGGLSSQCEQQVIERAKVNITPIEMPS